MYTNENEDDNDDRKSMGHHCLPDSCSMDGLYEDTVIGRSIHNQSMAITNLL